MRTHDQYDVIIVGARCAGAATARLLALRGLRVLMVDRATFPSDTLSSHYLQQAGGQLLRDWGLYDAVAATGCPPVSRMRLDFGSFVLRGFAPNEEGPIPDLCPRRSVLDKLLVDAAVEAGVELRTGFTVQELLSDDGRVTGIVGRTRDGAPCRDHARLVIGADGMRSFVARTVKAPQYNERPALTCNTFSYFGDLPLRQAELYNRPGLFIISAPTNDDLSQVIVIRHRERFAALRTLTDEQFLSQLDEIPELAERVRAARRADRFYGTADLPFFFRKPYGPGWALVGDAGYFKDPITAQGMMNAFQHASYLAESVASSFEDGVSLDAALSAYERARNANVAAMYSFTHELAELHQPPPDIQQVLRAASEQPEEANRFFGILGGTVPKDEFFAPGNVHRLLRDAGIPQRSWLYHPPPTAAPAQVGL